MPKVIYLLRHGEAKHNLYDTGPGSYERRRDPALVDPPLTEKGVSQVQAARQQIEAAPCLQLVMLSTGFIVQFQSSRLWPYIILHRLICLNIMTHMTKALLLSTPILLLLFDFGLPSTCLQPLSLSCQDAPEEWRCRLWCGCEFYSSPSTRNCWSVHGTSEKSWQCYSDSFAKDGWDPVWWHLEWTTFTKSNSTGLAKVELSGRVRFGAQPIWYSSVVDSTSRVCLEYSFNLAGLSDWGFSAWMLSLLSLSSTCCRSELPFASFQRRQVEKWWSSSSYTTRARWKGNELGRIWRLLGIRWLWFL